MEVGIFQVLGKFDYEFRKYRIDGEIYDHQFSAMAIKDWLNDRGVKSKVILLVPESIAELISDNPLELVRDEKRLKKAIKEKIDFDVEIKIIPSLGRYRNLEFYGSVDNTAIEIFRKTCEDGFSHVICDVSTGQNIYSTLLVESLRKYVVYKKLERILQGAGVFQMSVAFIPPVQAGKNSLNVVTDVEIQKVEVREFLEAPRCDVYRLCSEGLDNREVNIRFGEFLRSLNLAIENTIIAVNSIKMNTPLAFYHKEVLDMDFDIDEFEARFWEVVNFIQNPTFENGRVKRKIINGSNVFNIFYTIALARSIKDFSRSLYEKAEISELKQVFPDLYRKVGLNINARFLQRDLEELEERVSPGFRGYYLDCFPNAHTEKDGGKKWSKDQIRNFFCP